MGEPEGHDEGDVATEVLDPHLYPGPEDGVEVEARVPTPGLNSGPRDRRTVPSRPTGAAARGVRVTGSTARRTTGPPTLFLHGRGAPPTGVTFWGGPQTGPPEERPTAAEETESRRASRPRFRSVSGTDGPRVTTVAGGRGLRRGPPGPLRPLCAPDTPRALGGATTAPCSPHRRGLTAQLTGLVGSGCSVRTEDRGPDGERSGHGTSS